MFSKDVVLDRVKQTVNIESFDLDRAGKITLRDPPLESVTGSYYRRSAQATAGSDAMSFFSTFVVSFGAFLVLAAVLASWLFRTSGAPLAAKLAVPAILVALACYAPLAVNSMLGLPVTAALSGLPEKAELVAFVSHDEDHMVDLWLRPVAGKTGVPRAYEVALTEGMKKTLREAQEQMGRGRPAILAKRGAKSGAGHAGDRLGIGDDDVSGYFLDELAIAPLPPKG